MSAFPLPDRAVHPIFLRKLAQEKVPGGTGCLGELTTAQVVQLFVRPATLHSKNSFAECLLTGQLTPKYSVPWCPAGYVKDADGFEQQAFGRVRFFASHAWTYKFGALVSMMDNHYAQLPGTKGGSKFLPVYYWVDILAVTQHFSGDFKDHPDSDFKGVIRNCKAVLFTMHPWRSPIAPTRVWCLYEALAAIQAPGVEFQVVVDVKDSKDTRVQTVQTISKSIEVRTAQATVSSDKIYIIQQIEDSIGINAFNNTIRKRLHEALLAAVTPNAVEMGDTPALHELFKVGGCVRSDGISDLPSYFKFANETDMLNLMRAIQIRDLRPRGLALSGRSRTKELALSDAGLRGWDGESFSLREYTETETGRVMWAYLPVSPVLCQAVAELLVMPPPGSTSPSGSGNVSSRGVEDLWISLRAPRPDDFSRLDANGPDSPNPGYRPPSANPAAATAARAAARAVASPRHRRASALGPPPSIAVTTSSGSASRLSYLRTPSMTSPPSIPPGTSNKLSSLNSFFPSRRGSAGVPQSPPSFTGTILPASPGGGATGSPGAVPGSPMYGAQLRGSAQSRSDSADSTSLSGGLGGLLGVTSEPQVPLPPGRPALWVAVGASRTLKMLCLHQAVLGPQDLQMLGSALQATRTLETLQVIKCVAPGADSATSSATAKMNAELFAMGLGCGNLRQLHVRPGELTYVESFPASALGVGTSFLLRRVSLVPVALGPTAIRQLGKALSPQPYLHSLIAGLDPAPPATWMPKEPFDREHWLAYEDKTEPEMAARRRKLLGLDEEGQGDIVASAWDFKDDLGSLPDPDRGYAAVQQRAAAISFFLTLAAGWRDFAAYSRQYGKWAWARRTQPEELQAILQPHYDIYKAMAFELLKTGPEAFAAKFDPAEQRRRTTKTRLQKTFWEFYLS